MYVPHNGDAEEHDAGIQPPENGEEPTMKKPLLLRIVAAGLLLAIIGSVTWWYGFRDPPGIEVVTPEATDQESTEDAASNESPQTLPEPGEEVFDRMTISASGDLPIEEGNRDSDFMPLAQPGTETGDMELVVPASDTNEYHLPAAPATGVEREP